MRKRHGQIIETELINLADKKVAFADGRPAEQYKDGAAGDHRERARGGRRCLSRAPSIADHSPGALKNLLDHLPIESLGGKPVGIVAMGATQHHFLGVDWHLRDVLAWFGAIVAPTSVYLASADFVDGQLTESAKQDLKDLADAIIKLKQVATPGSFLGPRPLAGRRN